MSAGKHTPDVGPVGTFRFGPGARTVAEMDRDREAGHHYFNSHRCWCQKYHYTCADCGVDCTAGTPGAPARGFVDGTTRCWSCGRKHEDAEARLRNAASDLLEALEATAKLCRCNGTGTYTKDCTRCGDSTYDHVCNDEERPCELPSCIAARAAIAKARGGA